MNSVTEGKILTIILAVVLGTLTWCCVMYTIVYSAPAPEPATPPTSTSSSSNYDLVITSGKQVSISYPTQSHDFCLSAAADITERKDEMKLSDGYAFISATCEVAPVIEPRQKLGH